MRKRIAMLLAVACLVAACGGTPNRQQQYEYIMDGAKSEVSGHTKSGAGCDHKCAPDYGGPGERSYPERQRDR